LSSKTTSPKLSLGSSRFDERLERLLGRIELPAAHRSAAVQNDLQRRGLARLGPLAHRRSQVEQHRDLILGLDRDDIDIQQGVQAHLVPPWSLREPDWPTRKE
jgi:hypothetical protein